MLPEICERHSHAEIECTEEPLLYARIILDDRSTGTDTGLPHQNGDTGN
jgi:hypothetical protein